VPFASLDEGMGVQSADKNFSVGVHLLFQTRYDHVESDAGRESGFRLFMARPALRGVAFRPWIKYFVQWALEGTPSLLDAELVLQPVPEFAVKIGQFLTPFSREFLVPPGALLLPDFAPSNVLFRNNRDTGAMLFGSLFDNHVEYFGAAVNGNGINRPANDNAELEFIGRLSANVFGPSPYTEIPQLVTDAPGLTVGLNASYAEIEQTATAVNPATGATTTTKNGSAGVTKYGADLAVHAGPLSLQGEAYTRTSSAGGGAARSVARGGFAQVGIFVIPKVLELAGRGDLIQADVSHDRPMSRRFDGGVNYYVVGNHLKLQARYAWSATPTNIATAPDVFANTITAQAQLWF
jgi:hypothetical protein